MALSFPQFLTLQLPLPRCTQQVSAALSSSTADATTAELRLQAVLEERILEGAVGAEAAAAAAARHALQSHGDALAAVTAKVASLESNAAVLTTTGGEPLAALQRRVNDQAEAQSLFMDAVTQVLSLSLSLNRIASAYTRMNTYTRESGMGCVCVCVCGTRPVAVCGRYEWVQ